MANHLNVEIKAKHPDPGAVRQYLVSHQALFSGLDHQVDTYFFCNAGRLKLREGNIENALIHYERPDEAGPRSSQVTMMPVAPGSALKNVLTQALGVMAVVDKQREIYFIGNVKFHIDEVKSLGAFVEIEAIDSDGNIGQQRLQQQVDFYMQALGILVDDCLRTSYSDMLMNA